MRPIQLVMQAFGPYSAKEVVDFRKLGKNTLFLVTGPTGAGKTTIFDAICFALYGETSGNVRVPEQLRSQFSSAELMTEVILEFELKNITYHIHRIPRQEKPKSRGEGFTEQKSEATLICDTKGERKVYTGVLSVNNQIETILGINAEQFRQIMMIPQGEFQKLLIADSQEREKVLRKLFDTSLYRMFQLNIDERAKKLYKEIKSVQQLRQHELNKINYGEKESLENHLKQPVLNINEIIVVTKQLIKEDIIETKRLMDQIKKTDEEIERIIKKREEAKEINRKLKQREEILEKLSTYQNQQETIEKIKNQIERANLADGMSTLEEYWKQRKSEVEKLEKIQTTLIEEKLSIEKVFSDVENKRNHSQSEEQESIRETYRKKIEMLQKYIEQVDQFISIEAKMNSNNQKLQAFEKQKWESEDKLLKNKEKINQCRIEKEKGSKAQIKIMEIGEKISKKTNTIKYYSKAEKLILLEKDADLDYRKEQKQCEQNLVSMDKAEKEYKEKRLQFLRNQAALLAQEIEEGEPCPVCGSTEHTNLAKPFDDFVSEETLNTYEKEYEYFRKQQHVLEQNCTTKKEQLKNIQKNLQSVFEEELQIQAIRKKAVQEAMKEENKAINNLNEALKNQKKIVQGIEEYEKEIQMLEQEVVHLEKQLKQADEQWMVIQKEQIEQKMLYKQLSLEVPEDYRNKTKLSHEVEVLIEWIENDRKESLALSRAYEEIKDKKMNIITTLHSHEKRLADEAVYLKKQYQEFLTEIQAKGFEMVKEYEQAKLNKEEKSLMQKKVETYMKEKNSLLLQKENIEKETKGFTQSDITVYEEKRSYKKEERNKLDTILNQKKFRCEHNQSIIALVEQYQKEIGEKESRYAILGDLAQVALGNNMQRISFERYVLAAFLEDVLTAANIRLVKMTFGRYSLHRLEEVERKNRQSGLELQVFDNYTGKMRHVKTLSGGESFKTSLSMALGLSDVVQSYSGGIQLDTMFVDEGFGTLDQESLESAINCLIDLQKSGRLIGIISHVQELKERIESRLEVYSTQTGSRTEFV